MTPGAQALSTKDRSMMDSSRMRKPAKKFVQLEDGSTIPADDHIGEIFAELAFEQRQSSGSPSSDGEKTTPKD